MRRFQAAVHVATCGDELVKPEGKESSIRCHFDLVGRQQEARQLLEGDAGVALGRSSQVLRRCVEGLGWRSHPLSIGLAVLLLQSQLQFHPPRQGVAL